MRIAVIILLLSFNSCTLKYAGKIDTKLLEGTFDPFGMLPAPEKEKVTETTVVKTEVSK